MLSVFGQQSQVVPWQPSDENAKQYAYHPEPILFVHGINDNDATWGMVAIPALKNAFAVYDLPESATNFIGAISNLNARQEAYLHTFNYGDNPQQLEAGLGAHDKQSFEHIAWNAWEADMRHTSFTNTFLKADTTTRTIARYVSDPSNPYVGTYVTTNVTEFKDADYLQPAPNDDRMTLSKRINDDAVGIRQAYSSVRDDPNTWSQLVLVAHSMGGLLSHYYLCKCAETNIDSGVRRLGCGRDFQSRGFGGQGTRG